LLSFAQISHLAQDQVSSGLSGAEVIAACRNAALLALEEDDARMTGEYTGPLIQMRHLLRAVESMERQITPEMLGLYASYQGKSVQ
jgi:SpoVK/Ycf46/Vps4 family AAA+-type ATPase